jgi:hypothetical protein
MSAIDLVLRMSSWERRCVRLTRLKPCAANWSTRKSPSTTGGSSRPLATECWWNLRASIGDHREIRGLYDWAEVVEIDEQELLIIRR